MTILEYVIDGKTIRAAFAGNPVRAAELVAAEKAELLAIDPTLVITETQE